MTISKESHLTTKHYIFQGKKKHIMFASEEYVKRLGVLIDQNLSWKYCVLMNEKILK